MYPFLLSSSSSCCAVHPVPTQASPAQLAPSTIRSHNRCRHEQFHEMMLDPKKRSPLPWRPIEEKPWYVRHGARSDPQRQNPMTWRLYADPSASSSTGHAVVPSVSQPLLTCKYLKTLRTNDTDRATASPFCNTAKSSTDIFIYDGGTEGSDAENDSRGGPKYGQGASVPKRQKKDNHRICNIRLNGKTIWFAHVAV